MTDIEKRYFSVIGNLPTGWTFKRNDSLYEERKEFCDESESVNNLLSVSEYYGVAKRSEKVEDGDIVSRAETLDGYRRCFKNDFVMNYMLAWKGAQATSELDGVVSPSYAVFKPRGGILPRYANYLFRTKLYCGLFEVNSTGIIKSRLRLYPKAFLKINAIVPPLLEQQSIVSYLDKKCATIDEAIAKRRQIIEKLEEYRDVRIKQLVRDSFGLKSPSYVRIKYVVSNIYSGSPCLDDNNIEAKFPIYGGGKSMGYTSQYNVEDCILIGRVGANCGCVTRIKGKAWATDNALIIKPTINADYLSHVLESTNLRTNDESSAQPLVTGGKIKNTSIPLFFDESIQKKIVLKVDKLNSDIDSIISSSQELIMKLIEYRKSIIYNAVTGKIDCREAK